MVKFLTSANFYKGWLFLYIMHHKKQKVRKKNILFGNFINQSHLKNMF